MHETTIIQRALISVYDKTNIVELAEALHLKGVELISTGNTAELLKSHHLPVTSIDEYTGFPEMMSGRVKTLHPKVHGGILGRRDVDAETMIEHNIPDIDLVVVNLYPFDAVSKDPNNSFEKIIENIDIGGPTLIRGAAKNFEWCTVLVDPNDYQPFIKSLNQSEGQVNNDYRFQLAAKAFDHVAQYDSVIANFFNQAKQQNTMPSALSLHLTLKTPLRYGENPHQMAGFYQYDSIPEDSITAAKLHQGKALSFNNLADGDCALECVKSFDQPACVIVKHANPCGVAVNDDALLAYRQAYACDPTSAFGGIIAFNRPVDGPLLEEIFAQQFVEVIIAPEFNQAALKLAKQKENCRLLEYAGNSTRTQDRYEIRSIQGGALIQQWDHSPKVNYQLMTHQQVSPALMQDCQFAWQVVKYVKSNAIVLAKSGQTLGIGAGQMSRIFSTEIASLKAKESGLSLQGAVMASDAFFPFKDNVEKAHALGIQAIIQPGGSKRDQEVIDCANQLGIAMIFTGTRHFRH